ncbi:MAG: N-6 DNA methylase, partial [Candidatus Korarchaeota archaeon]
YIVFLVPFLSSAVANSSSDELLQVIYKLFEKMRHIFEKQHIKDGNAYKIYTGILRKIYPGCDEKELFLRHTVLHYVAAIIFAKIVGESIIDVLKNVKWNVCSPFLSFMPLQDGEVTEDMEDYLSNVEINKANIFRYLYERIIWIEERRKTGEYYTPKQLAEYVVSRFFIKDEIVVDPFCGDGVFLLAALEKKVREGENIDKAFMEVCGFEINPLVASIARMNLVLKYLELEGSQAPIPLIFNADLISHILGYAERCLCAPELKKMYNMLKNANLHVDDLIALIEAIKKYVDSGEPPELRNAQLTQVWNTIKNFMSSFTDYSLFDPLEIANVIAPLCIQRATIFTNPPWEKLSSLKKEYGTYLRMATRSFLMKKMKNVDYLTGNPVDITHSILSGSDVASVMLVLSLQIAENGAYVLPASSVYNGTMYGAGKILTYLAIHDKNYAILPIDQDIFGHGVKPTVLLIGNFIPLANGLPKETYLREIRTIAEYLSTDKCALAKKLALTRISPQGDSFIRGFKGGSIKSSNKYAGLIVEDFHSIPESNEIILALTNTGKIKTKKDAIKIARFLYLDGIMPFSIRENVIIYGRNKNDVIHQLKTLQQNALPEDRQKIEKLIQKLHYSAKIISGGLVQREDGYPVAAVAGGEFITSNATVYMCDDIDVLHYYAFILNTLSFLSLEPIRHQYARPAYAIALAKMEWRAQDWQYEMSRISRKLHDTMKSCQFASVRKALNFLEKNEYFIRGLELLENIPLKNIEDAVLLVAKKVNLPRLELIKTRK